jgi:hypothetical protein
MATSQSVDRHDPAFANLEILRQRLREALYAKKTRLRELAELCKRQRTELRAWVKERRAYALAELKNELRAARGAAQANRRARLQEARRSSTSAVELARAAVEIEHAHAAEQRRITRTHETKRVAVDKAHARSLSENAMSPATLKRLAPLLDKARGIRPAPGESRTEALWRYARAHPEEMHALLEPDAEKTIAKTRQEIATAEETIRTGGRGVAARPPRGRKASSPPASPTKNAKSSRPHAAPRRAPPAASVAIAEHPVVSSTEPDEPVRIEAPRPPAIEPPAPRPAAPAKGAPEPPPAARSRRSRRPRAQLGLAFEAPDATSNVPSAIDVAPAPPARHLRAGPAGVAPPSKGPNPYEQKKAARIERQRTRAEKLRAGAEASHARAKSIGDAIPMGQPILVGHHSQKRHERDLGKIDRSMRKSVELTRAADTLERRADRAEKSDAVSSDDPEAVAKLRVKLADVDKDRGRMRDANIAIRAGGDVARRLNGLGFSETRVKELLKPDPMGRIGFPAYALQNASTESARIKARIADLEKRAAAPARAPETIGGATVSEAENRVRIVFPCIPPESVRKELKGSGFHWSRSVGAWQRMTSNAAWSEAKRILTAYALPPPAAIETPPASRGAR